ncbi:HV69D protein, partial [Pardalotus punctatus]|nr:HV69D protein [Pardalotus punctatus]
SWSHCALFLLSAAVSLASAATLEQNPRELSVREGDPVTFQCSMRGDSMRYYYISWYRQGPSGIQEWIYKDGTYEKGFQDRFKIRDESTRNRYPL